MNVETQSKIERTLLTILKHSDFNEATEYNVRAEASRRLGLDLSSPQSRALVRDVVNSFLISRLNDTRNVTESTTKTVQEEEEEEEVNKETLNQTAHSDGVSKEEEKLENKSKGKSEDVDVDGFVSKLSSNRFVTVQTYRGTKLVSVREYYNKGGKQLPSNKGISLTVDQWSIVKDAIPAIEVTIQKMHSKLK